MVSYKGKVPRARATLIMEDPRTSKNMMGFKIYSGNERPREPCGESSRQITGNTLSKLGKSVPVNASKISLNIVKGKLQGPENTGKGGISVRTERKALADVSNISNARSFQPRNRPNGNPKSLKEKSEGGTLKQGKTNIVRSPCRPRISLTKSVVVANLSARKLIAGRVHSMDTNIGKFDKFVKNRTERKTLSVITNVNIDRKYQLRNCPSNNPRLMKGKLEGSKLLQGKNNSIKNPHWPRISLPRSVMVANASREQAGTTGLTMRTKSKIGRASINKPISFTKKDGTIQLSQNKEIEIPTGCSSEEKFEADVSCRSDENITTIISRPKCQRRRSYTLSLMARTEILGGADFVKKDELPCIDDNANPLEVVEYVDDIYQYYWNMEVLSPSLANYMSIQSEITPKMRGILINWLVEVHLKFELMQESLFLMVELLDRFLSLVSIKRNNLQMVGLTALLLASKYEDFWHPKIKELISISADSYTREQMLSMEKQMLTKLRYRLNVPTPYVFMLRFLKASQSDQKLEHLAFYLIELCLVEYEALKFKPSLLCASAVYVARCTLHVNPPWTSLLRRHARYEESQLRECALMVLGFQKKACTKRGRVTYDKFSSPERSSVASLKQLDELPL